MHYSTLGLAAAIAAAMTGPAGAQAPAAAPAAAAPQVTVGAAVSDAAGAPVGTVEAVVNGNATINTGTVKAAIPVTAFAKRPTGFAIAMTKAQLEAAVAQTKPPEITVGTKVNDTTGAPVGTVTAVANGNVTVDTGTAKGAIPIAAFAQRPNGLVVSTTRAQIEAAVAKPADIKVGASIVGPKGEAVGSVAEVGDTLVTVQTPNTKVQLPKTAFAQGANGGLVIGMTVDQLEAAAKAASPGPGK